MLRLMTFGETSCRSSFFVTIFWSFMKKTRENTFFLFLVVSWKKNYLYSKCLEIFVMIFPMDSLTINLEVNFHDSLVRIFTFCCQGTSQSVNIFGILPNDSIIKSLQLNLNKWKILWQIAFKLLKSFADLSQL